MSAEDPKEKATIFFLPRLLVVNRYRAVLFDCLKTYTRADFKADLFAGINVAFVALPLCIAFAIAAGAPPETGIYTSIFGGLVVGVLGGSRLQVSGPTAAFVAILAPICLQKGLAGLMIAGAMSGLILIIMGLSGLGALIKFVPYPVSTGFTTGIAILIATASIKDLLGLNVHYEHLRTVSKMVEVEGQSALLTTQVTETISTMPQYYHEKLEALWTAWFQTPYEQIVHSSCMGFSALLVLIFFPRLMPRLSRFAPAPIMAVLVASLLSFATTQYLDWNDIPKLSSFPSGLPGLNWALYSDFNWSFHSLQELILPATIIALLGAMTSLMSAVVSDGLSGRRHDSNSELVGQGIGNVVSPVFGGIALSGAIARTICNLSNGARTPMATIFHSLFLALLLLIFAPLATFVPLAALAAILLHVAINMANFSLLRRLLSAPFSDVFVLANCFLLTVFVDMATAVVVGMILAAMLFMRRMAEITSVDALSSINNDAEMQSHDIHPSDIPRGVTIYSVDGPFFFGASEKAMTAIESMGRSTRIVIMRLNLVPVIDATGLFALEKVHDYLKQSNVKLIISGLKSKPRKILEKSGFLKKLGSENMVADVEWAVVRCYEILGPDAKDRPTGKTGQQPSPTSKAASDAKKNS